MPERAGSIWGGMAGDDRRFRVVHRGVSFGVLLGCLLLRGLPLFCDLEEIRRENQSCRA
jgi:hypothetical protein